MNTDTTEMINLLGDREMKISTLGRQALITTEGGFKFFVNLHPRRGNAYVSVWKHGHLVVPETTPATAMKFAKMAGLA